MEVWVFKGSTESWPETRPLFVGGQLLMHSQHVLRVSSIRTQSGLPSSPLDQHSVCSISRGTHWIIRL